MGILFVHGAGGWVDDQPLAGQLRTGLDTGVDMPRFPDADMSAASWRARLDRQLESGEPDQVMVGHSFGSTTLLLRLADGWPDRPMPRGFVLLATPYWGTEGWQAEYALPAGFAPPEGVPVFLHHCRDDETVPFEHLDRFASLLPDTVIRRHEAGGHQFEGQMPAVIEDVRTLLG